MRQLKIQVEDTNSVVTVFFVSFILALISED